MVETFNPREILEISVNVEKNGQRLYADLENKAKYEKIKSIWRYLKEQEEKHRKAFQDMLNNVADYTVQEYAPGDYTNYLRAISGEYIVTGRHIEDRLKKGFRSDSAAVDFGIKIEKDSILTYSAFKEILAAGQQPVLDEIIKEEWMHLVRLAELKEKMEA